MKTPVLIQPLTPALHPAMLAASATDGGHHAPLATHVFTRAGEVVGAAALCSPVLFFWAHSTALHRRESLDLAKRCKAQAVKQYQHNFLSTCSPDSPFYPLMPGLGFTRLGNADFYAPAP